MKLERRVKCIDQQNRNAVLDIYYGLSQDGEVPAEQPTFSVIAYVPSINTNNENLLLDAQNGIEDDIEFDLPTKLDTIENHYLELFRLVKSD